jgi:hypothetical protein
MYTQRFMLTNRLPWAKKQLQVGLVGGAYARQNAPALVGACICTQQGAARIEESFTSMQLQLMLFGVFEGRSACIVTVHPVVGA